MANHLLHQTLAGGSLLEIAPTRMQAGELQDPDQPGFYVFEATDDQMTVRVTVAAPDWARFIRQMADKLDEIDALGAPKPQIVVAGSLPANGASG